jgi:hypothetical protein
MRDLQAAWNAAREGLPDPEAVRVLVEVAKKATFRIRHWELCEKSLLPTLPVECTCGTQEILGELDAAGEKAK